MDVHTAQSRVGDGLEVEGVVETFATDIISESIDVTCKSGSDEKAKGENSTSTNDTRLHSDE